MIYFIFSSMSANQSKSVGKLSWITVNPYIWHRFISSKTDLLNTYDPKPSDINCMQNKLLIYKSPKVAEYNRYLQKLN